MTRQYARTEIAELARVVEPVVARQVDVPQHPARTFELPPRLHLFTVGAYLSFIAIMAAAFGNGELLIPLAICGLIIVAGFATPGLWTVLKPEDTGDALRWAEFRRKGIVTATGQTSALDATVQVMILPVLILLWGVAVAIIAALV